MQVELRNLLLFHLGTVGDFVLVIRRNLYLTETRTNDVQFLCCGAAEVEDKSLGVWTTIRNLDYYLLVVDRVPHLEHCAKGVL